MVGKRLEDPAMYINEDVHAGMGETLGVGGPTGQRSITRPSIMSLWSAAKHALEQVGAEVVAVGFPFVSNYEGAVKTPLTFIRAAFFLQLNCTMETPLYRSGLGMTS